MFERHFHIATEGLRAVNTFALATLGFGFFDVDIVIEEAPKGAGGGVRSDDKRKSHVLVIHVRFKDQVVHRVYEHKLTDRNMHLAVRLVQRFNDLKVLVRSFINKKSSRPINIHVGGLTLKEPPPRDEK